MAKKRKRLWRTAPIGGSQWKYVFSNLPDQYGCTTQGECDNDKSCISINYSISREQVHETAFHETGHAIAEKVGLRNLIHEFFPGAKEEAIYRFEEVLMRTYNQSMYETLLNGGWFNLHKIPEWFDK